MAKQSTKIKQEAAGLLVEAVKLKPQRFIKPGLWFTGLSLDVEQVNPRMKLPCAECQQLPSEQRLRIRQGSGRSQQGAVLCKECSIPFAKLLETELDRLQDYLLGTGIESVRLPGRNWPIKPKPKTPREIYEAE